MVRALLQLSKGKGRCLVSVLLLFKGWIFTVWGVWGNVGAQQTSTKQDSGQREAEGMFSTMACLIHYKQPLFHHESWFKTTALGHKNQPLTTSSGTTIPSVLPSNVDSMINIHPLPSLIISLHSFLCTFLLAGVVCVEQLVGKTERAELLHTSCRGKKPPQCSVSALNEP